MNKAMLVGRLTRDLELRKTPTGKSVCNFTVAINRTFTNTNGEREADFINCVTWGRTADNMATYVGKGSLVGVDGRIQTRSYENQQGQKVYVTEVFADSVQFLESKSVRSNENKTNIEPKKQSQSNNEFFKEFDKENSSSEDILSNLDISDEELPF